MDNTIRIITDSGCDISKENEEKYKGLLEIMPFMVTIQGKSLSLIHISEPTRPY